MVKRKFYLSLLCLLLSGCVNFAPIQKANTQTYTLTAEAPAHPKHYVYKPVTVIVNLGQALPGMQSDRIVYQKAGEYQLKYYAYHRWVDSPVTLITGDIATALTNTGAFKAVVNAPLYVGKVDDQVSVALIQLQQNFTSDTHSQTTLTLQLVVVNVQTNRVVAAKRFSTAVDAAPNAEGGVAAANQALTKLMPDIVQFVYQNVG